MISRVFKISRPATHPSESIRSPWTSPDRRTMKIHVRASPGCMMLTQIIQAWLATGKDDRFMAHLLEFLSQNIPYYNTACCRFMKEKNRHWDHCPADLRLLPLRLYLPGVEIHDLHLISCLTSKASKSSMIWYDQVHLLDSVKSILQRFCSPCLPTLLSTVWLPR